MKTEVDSFFYDLIMKWTAESIAYDIIHGPLHIDHILEYAFLKHAEKRKEKRKLKRIESKYLQF